MESRRDCNSAGYTPQPRNLTMLPSEEVLPHVSRSRFFENLILCCSRQTNPRKCWTHLTCADVPTRHPFMVRHSLQRLCLKVTVHNGPAPVLVLHHHGPPPPLAMVWKCWTANTHRHARIFPAASWSWDCPVGYDFMRDVAIENRFDLILTRLSSVFFCPTTLHR